MTINTLKKQENMLRTASGIPWQPRHNDARTALAMQQHHGISEVVANILVGRGVGLDEAPAMLAPSLKTALPDPLHLLDMNKAIARLIRAIESRETIAVFGDYDVDGATSCALLVQYFNALERPLLTYIPDRMKEGYGPNIQAFDALIAQHATLILTVDCGTMAHAPIAHAKQKGCDVVVIDHHIGTALLPEAVAVVNPNRVDETSPHRNLCAAGVVFLLLVGVNRALREAGFFNASRPEPNLMAMLDLVALGTVCDVMTLTGLNRAYVAQGLKIMHQRGNAGLATLADIARMDTAPTTYHLGFLLGPRINAGGRVGESGLGLKLLTSPERVHAEPIAKQLDHYNLERQAIETSVLEAAMAQAEMQTNAPVMVLAAQGWHEGVIGIVAGRIKEQFSRPAAVISMNGDHAKGSARSVPGVDFGAAIHRAHTEGLITAGGGHAMAAGFSLPTSGIAALQNYLCRTLEADVARYSEARVKKFDGWLRVESVNQALLDAIASVAPYGMGFPSPRFALKDCQIVHRDILKGQHIKLQLASPLGKGRLSAIAFRAVGTTLGDWLLHEKSLHLSGEVKANLWQGTSTPQLVIDDAAKN